MKRIFITVALLAIGFVVSRAARKPQTREQRGHPLISSTWSLPEIDFGWMHRLARAGLSTKVDFGWLHRLAQADFSRDSGAE